MIQFSAPRMSLWSFYENLIIALSNICEQCRILNYPERTGRQFLDSVCPQNTAVLLLLSSLFQGPEKLPQEWLETVQYAEQTS